MQKITKYNIFITKEVDHYTIAHLVVNDDLLIDLDMPLYIASTLFVAGSMRSNVDVSIDGKTIINGAYHGKTLASKKGLSIGSMAAVKGSLRSDENISVTELDISNDIVTNKTFFATGKVVSKGSLSAGEVVVLNEFSTFAENIVAGLMVDAKSGFACNGRFKVAGSEESVYARVCVADSVFIKTGMILNGYVRGKRFDTIIDYRKCVTEIASMPSEDMSYLDKMLVIAIPSLVSSEQKIQS